MTPLLTPVLHLRRLTEHVQFLTYSTLRSVIFITPVPWWMYHNYRSPELRRRSDVTSLYVYNRWTTIYGFPSFHGVTSFHGTFLTRGENYVLFLVGRTYFYYHVKRTWSGSTSVSFGHYYLILVWSFTSRGRQKTEWRFTGPGTTNSFHLGVSSVSNSQTIELVGL